LPPRAAAHLGLPAGLPVAQGGADAFIGVIGLGVIAPGQMAMVGGLGVALAVPVARASPRRSGCRGCFFHRRHVLNP
jgi:sugar (pentulose or hexulose) kinase